MKDNERLYYFDSMRAVLMLLGIVIHAAQIFSPRHVLPIYNDSTSNVMYYIVEIFHLFRMPAFFVVSGFFCYLTLSKYGTLKFLKVRLPRIVIPLVSTLLTFNLLLYYFLFNEDWLSLTLSEYIITGRYIVHLWFLVDLVYFFLITALLHHFVTKFNLSNSSSYITNSWLILFAMPIFALGIMFLNKIGIPIYIEKWGVFSPYSLLYNYIFFAFGYLISCNKKLLNSITYTNSVIYILLITSAILTYNTLGKGLISSITKEYLYTLSQWFAIALCFKIFKMAFSKKSSTMSKLSEASYSVYLFHYLVLMLIADFIVDFNPNAYIGFSVLVVFTALISYAIHNLLIENNKILKLIFNGK